MCTEKTDSMITKALKSLCCGNGWSYGVFWRFDQRNSLLLTMEDAYYEEQMGVVIDNMLLEVHMPGSGIVGQVAFTKKHRWIFSDAHSRGQNTVGSVNVQDVFQDESEFHRQFSLGIQTIAVISVEPQGVVQFGSTQKILERMEFVDQTKRLFREMESCDGLGLSESAPSSSNSEICGPSGFFASLISSENSYFGNLKPVHDISSKNFIGTASSFRNLTQSSPFTSDHGTVTPLIRNSSHLGNQLQMAGTEALVKLSNKSSTHLQQPLLQSTTYVNHSAAQNRCTSTWGGGDSTPVSFEQQLSSEMRIQGSQDVFPDNLNSLVSFRNAVQIFSDPIFTSVRSTGAFSDIEKNTQCGSGNLMHHQQSALLFHGTEGGLPERSTGACTFQQLSQASDFATSLYKSCPLDNIFQWVEHSDNTLETALNNDLSQAMKVTSVPSSLNGADVCKNILDNHPANSVQSSITATFTFDGKEKCSNISGVQNDLFDSLGVDFGCGQSMDLLDDILMPTMSGGHLDFSTETSQCISEQHVGSMVGPQKGLFSKLGLEQLLDEEEQKGSSTSCAQVQSAGLPCFGRNMNILQPVYDRTNNLEPKKEVIPKSEVDSWIGDRYSMNRRSTAATQPKREEPGKVTKKKAKPGARPRPRDRQQIQERVQELRELIPNGVKMSIDSLLAQTIKHILFFQNVTKHADKLKQANEQKMVFHENGLFMKDDSGSSGSGVTWAYEFGAQTMVCPLVVEDLSTPGQMLIEMLCEEQGFFLEIVDIIRGFGLIILKGVMEARENKIWARFIVEAEASSHVARVEIFMALVQLLEPTTTNGINVSGELDNVIDGGVNLFNNYQQPLVPLPVSLADIVS
ncbi:hypothetical protein F0562_007793 [Nyssa sinensis]|uniref:BHLH domain-containing protein n=1 Tax=Nyssa sinensis TaxID=561372 RepID=A0A5J5A9N8_9ASTE|nr:hypothetical protein F0562_007793 [Nyssa sinensis]